MTQISEEWTLEQARELLDSEGITQTSPRPTPLGWFDELGARVMQWLSSALGLSAEASAALSKALAFSVIVVAGLAAVGLLITVWRRQRRSGPVSSVKEPAADPAFEDIAEPDWQRRFSILHAAGDLRGAVQALWCWLFAALGVERPRDSSWTGRRLLRDAHREDLLPLVLDLEAATYGPRPAAAEGLERLSRQMVASFSGARPTAPARSPGR